MMRKVFFVGSTRSDIRDFPKAVRSQTGHQIHRLQLGLMPDDWKPLSTVGKGVKDEYIPRTSIGRYIFWNQVMRYTYSTPL